jgi:hypothetical protein
LIEARQICLPFERHHRFGRGLQIGPPPRVGLGSLRLIDTDHDNVTHQALGMKVPAELYARSPRVYRGLEELTIRSTIRRSW